MSTRGVQGDKPAQSEGPSKREQMKIEQAIKIIEGGKHSGHKTHRRKHSDSISAQAPHPRKLLKIDKSEAENAGVEQISGLSHSDPLSHFDEQLQEAQPPTIKRKPVLNSRYSISCDEGELFSYLLNYSYVETNKQIEKESQDWSELDKIGTKALRIIQEEGSRKLINTWNEQFQQNYSRNCEPFSKSYRQFVQKTSSMLLSNDC